MLFGSNVIKCYLYCYLCHIPHKDCLYSTMYNSSPIMVYIFLFIIIPPPPYLTNPANSSLPWILHMFIKVGLIPTWLQKVCRDELMPFYYIVLYCTVLYFIICHTDWSIPGHMTFSNVAYWLKIPYWTDNIFQYYPLIMVLLVWHHIVLLWCHIVILYYCLIEMSLWCYLVRAGWPSFHMSLTAWYCWLVLSWYLVS